LTPRVRPIYDETYRFLFAAFSQADR